MTKILFISEAIYPYFKGGREKRLDVLSRGLASKGYEVEIWTMQWWQSSSIIVDGGRTLKAICPLIPIYTKKLRRSLWEPIRFMLAILRQWNQPAPSIIDIDHIPYLPLFAGRLLAWKWKIPMLATWHEIWGRQAWNAHLGYILGFFASVMELITLRLPDLILTVSNFTDRRLKTLKFRGHKPSFIVQNGIFLEEINPAPKDRLNYDVVTAGRLLPHKGIDLLLRAAECLKSKGMIVIIGVIGDGPEIDHLKQLARELNISSQVHFFGFVPTTQDFALVMKSSRICVLPSYREGFGLVAIEANAYGLPVVTIRSSQNAILDLIQGGKNGLVVEPTREALAEGIRTLLEAQRNDERYISSQCCAVAKQYQWSKSIHKLDEKIKQTILCSKKRYY